MTNVRRFDSENGTCLTCFLNTCFVLSFGYQILMLGQATEAKEGCPCADKKELHNDIIGREFGGICIYANKRLVAFEFLENVFGPCRFSAKNALNGDVCNRCGVYVGRPAKYVGNELHYNNRALFEQLLASSIVSGNAIEQRTILIPQVTHRANSLITKTSINYVKHSNS